MNPTSAYIDLGTSIWEITRAIPDDEEKDGVNVYNMATAVGARGFEYYGGLMNQMMDGMQRNTALLNRVNGMDSWNVADWNNLEFAAARTTDLLGLGLIAEQRATLQFNQNGTYHSATAGYPPTANIIPSITQGNTAGLYENGGVVSYFNSALGDTLWPIKNLQTYPLTPDGYIGNTHIAYSYLDAGGVKQAGVKQGDVPRAYDQPYPGDGTPLTYPDIVPGAQEHPAGPGVYQFNGEVVLAEGSVFISRDNVMFALIGGQTRQLIPGETLVYYKPTSADLTNWKGEKNNLITSLTQLSQQEQLQLQDLIASYNKFMNFVTNVMERKERDLVGIADRF